MENVVHCEEVNVSCETQDNSDLQELTELDGVEVWGQHQEVLEQQALIQLQNFAAEHSDKQASKEIEDGEVCDDLESGPSVSGIRPDKEKPVKHFTLDINSYILRQEELKKRQVKRRVEEVSERSRSIAEKITKRITEKRDCQFDSGFESGNHKRRKSETEEDNQTKVNSDASGSEYIPSDCSDSDGESKPESSKKENIKRRSRKYDLSHIKKVKDDGDVEYYSLRLKEYYKELKEETKSDSDDENDGDYNLDKGLLIPCKIWNKLYTYQQDGIKWLWNIHQKSVGGLLGDEMGLGKTVQVIVFLAALKYSKIVFGHYRYEGLGPCLIVCPATVLHQWVQHFHKWWPPFRVAVLHQSGSYTGNKVQLIKEIAKEEGILITTYQGLLKHRGDLFQEQWHYVILDEGHKIRNPTTKVTITVKRFGTPHRLMLTGSPMQNNLQELWSLFDFIVPGRLGTLQVFMDHFANPIMQGGYTNASPMQEATALSIATALKEMITPYMIRRTKLDVKDDIFLPNKSEQVLFCSLTEEQRDLYKGYLLSEHVGQILGHGSRRWCSDNQMKSNILVAITTLRKICNHPDLYLADGEDEIENSSNEEENRFGFYKRSGKMVVVSALLKIWKRQGHRVLLFTQGRGMINIFEMFLLHQGYKYLKMDGSTSVSSRQHLIDSFNNDDSYNVFLLTTRVGGLGVNLIGADRVIIYDPDWNPATDTQARERAWRIGQLRQVTIYRLLSAGTIEEKMYQRQVWKQLLSNKVLIDPKTQKFFRNSDLHDLFSLQEHTDGITPETANIFKNSKVEVAPGKSKKAATEKVQFSDDKIQAMKSLAQKIAKSITQTTEKPVTLPNSSRNEEKVKLKQLTPVELRIINRKKALPPEQEPAINKIDDEETNISFTKALVIAEKTAIKYHRKDRNKPPVEEKVTVPVETKCRKEKHKKSEKIKVDESGEIEGEKVYGLIKREISSRDRNKKVDADTQDQYVLERLFSKSGVHTALKHDVIVQSGNRNENSLKIHYEAKIRTEKAMKALRKSRLNGWTW